MVCSVRSSQESGKGRMIKCEGAKLSDPGRNVWIKSGE